MDDQEDESGINAQAKRAADEKRRGMFAGQNIPWIELIPVNQEVADRVWWRNSLGELAEYDDKNAFRNDCDLDLYGNPLDRYVHPQSWKAWAWACCDNRAKTLRRKARASKRTNSLTPEESLEPGALHSPTVHSPIDPQAFLSALEERRIELQQLVERLPSELGVHAAYDRRTAFLLFCRQAMKDLFDRMMLTELEAEEIELRQVAADLTSRGGELLNWDFANAYRLLAHNGPSFFEIWQSYLEAREGTADVAVIEHVDLTLLGVLCRIEGGPTKWGTLRRWRSRSKDYAVSQIGKDRWERCFEHFLPTRGRD
jgi:hypothetical protein